MIEQNADNSALAKYFEERGKSLPVDSPSTEKGYGENRPTERSLFLKTAKKMRGIPNPYKLHNLYATRDTREIGKCLDLDRRELPLVMGLLDEYFGRLENV